MEKQAEYYGRPRREMQRFVPREARRILDVGCGAGAFAAGLRDARRGTSEALEIWGIEVDAQAAGLAASRLDRVLVGDALAMAAELPAGRFDCIVLNDVLEHLLEPGTLLRALQFALTPDGVLVASIPNVRYFPNLVDLVVRGRWDYTDEGILDRTHLRFFTRSSMIGLLRESGYEGLDTTGINPTGSRVFKLFNLLTLGGFSDMGYLQFACRARPAAVRP